MPTHVEDRKFSGNCFLDIARYGYVRLTRSILYDVYMGVELNPRLGQVFNFKLSTNDRRPGIIAWTLLDLSFAMWQYQLHGKVTNSMIVSETYICCTFLTFYYY